MRHKYLKAVLNSYAEIFFLQGYLPGLAFFLCTFINPNIGIAGLICVLTAYLFALFLGMKDDFLSSGFYTYNPLLVGLSIGYLFKLDFLTVFFIATAGILTFIVTYSLANIFSYYFNLPVLSLPFVIVSCIAYLAASQYSNLFVNGLYVPSFFNLWESKLPLWFLGLTKSLGAIFFLPHVLAGVILLGIILAVSRIFFLLALAGYFTGTIVVGLFTGSLSQSFQSLNAFNFILIAMAIGGVFLIPSPKSYFLALIAVVTSSLFLEAVKGIWMQYGLLVFTLPFNLITMGFIYVMGILGYPYLAKFYRGTPERTLDHYLTYNYRFPGSSRTLCLPFSGEWTVWQGIKGRWTHKGPWQYAIDFVITDEQGKTFENEGKDLEHYYCFRKPILAPVRGRVIKVVNDIPDNPVGEVNKEHNWGNLVLLYDERGFYVLLCHLLQGSIKVKEGEWVERGKLIGLCGNSGYSPQPHLHVHVQLTSTLGVPTVPFSFIQYMSPDKVYFANQLPLEGQRVIALYPDKSLDMKMTFLLDEKMDFVALVNNVPKTNLEMKTKMDGNGEFYFEINESRLYFGKWEGTFYFYRLEGKITPELKALFTALPRLPLVFKEGLHWEDFLPLHVVLEGLKKHLVLLASSFLPSMAKVKGEYRFLSPDEITGEIKELSLKTYVKLHPIKGIERVEVNTKGQKIVLRREGV